MEFLLILAKPYNVDWPLDHPLNYPPPSTLIKSQSLTFLEAFPYIHHVNKFVWKRLFEVCEKFLTFDKSASGEDVEEEREKKIRGTSQG